MPRRNSKPEVTLRRELHRRGLRFRIHAALPGRPDVVFTRARLAVFVDGCFWHSCPHHATSPKANARWWSAKLARNVERDREQSAALEAAGWAVLRIWEHEAVLMAADRVQSAYRSRIASASEQ